MSRDKKGCIYFIQAPNGLVKVGFAQDIFRRFVELQHMSPVKLELIAIIPDATREEEHRLHMLMEPNRSHGEWFWSNSTMEHWIRERGRKVSIETDIYPIQEYSCIPVFLRAPNES